MTNPRLIAIAIAEAALIIIGVYGYVAVYAPGQSISLTGTQPITLQGAGATLAYPLLSAIKTRYHQNNPGIQVNFSPVGSIAGLSLLIDKTVDFAATYPPIPKGQWKNFPSLPLHIPESISAVVVSYNVPELTQPLKLNGTVLAEIFRGNITSWNDPQVQNLNPGQNLPNHYVLPYHMAEAEGTTFVFTSYLNLFPNWPFKPSTSWPSSSQVAVGSEVSTDALVANQIETTQYTIGYMELSYAIDARLTYASIQNSAGNYIVPSETSAAASLRRLTHDLPRSDQDWSSVNLLNEPDGDAYPLVTFTYLIVYQDLSVVADMDLTKAKALAAFVWYLIHDGQALGLPLGYVPLPPSVVTVDEAGTNLISFRGQHRL